ncbi:hypothetical protein D0868_06254 [Hortaea werneckii]|uniref:DUF92 domain-containing protein n=1 Tax=Hortaea werneckii TaxID=91943 RepID=A0A3M6YRL4_HORWE|nr:hypothetical protein D0868_06254 [Hortaea werneckii]
MDLTKFLQTHIPQITATVLLVTYSHLRSKLTIPGILAGIASATIHMLHPYPAFFWLLILFFLLGTLVTRIGHRAKQTLTTSSTGGAGGEGPRSAVQVVANSGFACLLILAHTWILRNANSPFISSHLPLSPGPSFPNLKRVLPIGVLVQYAAVAADTFSSELGILSATTPFLITAPWRKVPRGTNGGVTMEGLMYGALGAWLLTVTAVLALRFCSPARGEGVVGGGGGGGGMTMDARTAALVSFMGLVGSVVDSVLGALTQVTVTDKGSGKVVEGPGGQRVLVADGSKEGGSRGVMGRDWLTNNGVNFVMAALTSGLGMGVAWVSGLSLDGR